jgi:hypothetical protein
MGLAFITLFPVKKKAVLQTTILCARILPLHMTGISFELGDIYPFILCGLSVQRTSNKIKRKSSK